MKSQSSRVTSASGCQRATPAFATKASRRPKRSTVSATSRSFSSGRETSARMNAERRPSAWISAYPPGGLLVLRDVVDRDVEAAFREHESDAAADATLAGGAGDERHRHQITTAISPSSLTRTSYVRRRISSNATHLPVGTWNSRECHGQVTTSPSQIQANRQSVCGP